MNVVSREANEAQNSDCASSVNIDFVSLQADARQNRIYIFTDCCFFFPGLASEKKEVEFEMGKICLRFEIILSEFCAGGAEFRLCIQR